MCEAGVSLRGKSLIIESSDFIFNISIVPREIVSRDINKALFLKVSGRIFMREYEIFIHLSKISQIDRAMHLMPTIIYYVTGPSDSILLPDRHILIDSLASIAQ